MYDATRVLAVYDLVVFRVEPPQLFDEAFEATQIPELPRLSFQECADRCAEDFERAYDLLPLDWDETLAGMQTGGKNDGGKTPKKKEG